jgi:hypothetical protein
MQDRNANKEELVNIMKINDLTENYNGNIVIYKRYDGRFI